jgi:hypothetical protein
LTKKFFKFKIKNMKAYTYKGWDVQRSSDGKTVEVRRHYPPSVHKGFPAPFKKIVDNAPSAGQASKQLEDFIALQNVPAIAQG